MKAGFVSLGCAKNLVDTEVMLGIMKNHGIELTTNYDDAEILIVNTCAFILAAKEESISNILELAKYKNNKCRSLIVAGCLSQLYKNDLLNEMPEVDAVIGTGAWDRIMEAIEETLSGRRVILIGEQRTIYNAKTPRLRTTPNYSAYVKISEGCNNRCAFCSIPLIRGKQISRTIEDIRAEVEQLSESGVKEINLIAQDTTAYGIDLYGRSKLVELLRELVTIEKIHWIRILYAYPKLFSDELIDLIANESKICNYIDLPLQHASNKILRKMNRPDTRESIEVLLKKIRIKIPSVAIRSTLIVGFPGETNEDFLELKNFLQEQRLDKVGIFTYSREENTPAYNFPDQVSEEIMQERYHDLMSMQSLISQEINESLEGQELEVLIENQDAENSKVKIGRSYREAPEVDGLVYIENDDHSRVGDMVRAKISAGFVYDIAAERID